MTSYPVHSQSRSSPQPTFDIPYSAYAEAAPLVDGGKQHQAAAHGVLPPTRQPGKKWPWQRSDYQPAQNQAKSTLGRRFKFFASYASDWTVTILVAGAFFVLDNITGFKREFSLQDRS